MCSLDMINAACYLAFLDEDYASKMKFSGEYFFASRKLAQLKEDENELVSQFSDSDISEFSDLDTQTPKNRDLAEEDKLNPSYA